MHARVPAQLCPGHTGVQSIDSHTRAWGEEGRGETGGGADAKFTPRLEG